MRIPTKFNQSSNLSYLSTILIPSCVGTNVMPFLESLLLVIKMASTTKQQTISLTDTSELIENEEKRVSVQTETYDEESRKFRKLMAQREALRQLEQRKTLARASALRMSFIR